MTKFQTELAELLNKYSMENESATPDFILAHYLACCLDVYNSTLKLRVEWYNRATVAVEPETP